MKILVIGSGGREHALVWKIAQSRLADKIFCAPGNGGTGRQAENIDIKAEDIAALLAFARKEKIALTVVGPEAPLACGIVDEFARQKLRIFGPNRKAAQLEASKVFAKELMAKYKVPTAPFGVFSQMTAAKAYIAKIGAPCVIKADGLAAGKGVVVAGTEEEALQAAEAMLCKNAFGEAGRRIIVEECLSGQEASILVLTDSKAVIPLASSQDHKRVFDHDQGPNTGGMGAYSPAPVVTPDLFQKVINSIVYPTLDGLAREGIEFRGVLYAGVMLTERGPFTLEFNARFGDPETEAILPRLSSDLVEVMAAAADGTLSRVERSGGLRWDRRSCVCVVCSSGGYPGSYENGKAISGLPEAEAVPGVVVFHAGTKRAADGTCLSAGGRVLGVTGLGDDLAAAIKTTYSAVERIRFEGMHVRRDIGAKGVAIEGKQ